MSIESISGNTVNPQVSAKSVVKNAEDVKRHTGASGSTDSIEITSTAQSFKAASDSAPLVNEDLVAHIKSAIETGNYRPNAGNIAQKLLQFENKLSNST